MKRGSRGALPDPGSFIYAYCNVRTNQVLYSLERTLKPAHLKQLPDVGANNTPPTLRKDSWRPFFSVGFSQDEIGRQQRQYVFWKLREHRKLHETNWTPSPLLSRPYTQEEIEEMERKLRERGGSKRETVYDIIKREKHKMRVKAVMDQKANSIADLAAILLDQDAVGQEAVERNREDRERHKRRTANGILALAKEAEDGGLETASGELKDLQDQQAAAPEKTKRRYARSIAQLDLKVQMMRFALPAVTEALKTARPLALAEAESHRAAQDQPSGSTETSAAATAAPRSESEILSSILPSWPAHIDPHLPRPPPEHKNPRLASSPLDRASTPRSKLRFNRPVFSTEGISIRWANLLDAEYAHAWPAAVQQLPMGLARHAAPLPPESPRHPWQLAGRPEGEEFPGIAVDLASFKEMQVSKRSRRLREMREKERVLEKLKEGVLAEIRGKKARDLEEVGGEAGNVEVVGKVEQAKGSEKTV